LHVTHSGRPGAVLRLSVLRNPGPSGGPGPCCLAETSAWHAYPPSGPPGVSGGVRPAGGSGAASSSRRHGLGACPGIMCPPGLPGAPAVLRTGAAGKSRSRRIRLGRPARVDCGAEKPAARRWRTCGSTLGRWLSPGRWLKAEPAGPAGGAVGDRLWGRPIQLGLAFHCHAGRAVATIQPLRRSRAAVCRLRCPWARAGAGGRLGLGERQPRACGPGAGGLHSRPEERAWPVGVWF